MSGATKPASEMPPMTRAERWVYIASGLITLVAALAAWYTEATRIAQ